MTSFRNYLIFEDFILYPYRTFVQGIGSLVDSIRNKIFPGSIEMRNSLDERVSLESDEDNEQLNESNSSKVEESIMNQNCIVINSSEDTEDENEIVDLPKITTENKNRNNLLQSVFRKNSQGEFIEDESEILDLPKVTTENKNRNNLCQSVFRKNSQGDYLEEEPYYQGVASENKEDIQDENDLNQTVIFRTQARGDAQIPHKQCIIIEESDDEEQLDDIVKEELLAKSFYDYKKISSEKFNKTNS